MDVRSRIGACVGALGLAAIVVTVALGTTAAAAGTGVHAVRAGTFSFAGAGRGQPPASPAAPPHQPMNKTLRHTSASQVPRIGATPVVAGAGGAIGFNGIDDVQQASAGTGPYAGTQLDTTPPDQGLCVGQGDVL